MKHTGPLAFALCLLAAPVFTPAQSGRELYDAANAQNAADDKKLNAAYEALIKDIRATNKDRADLVIERLRESQRAWLKFREAQIGFVGAYTEIGSSSARAAGLSSYSHELTTARIKDFAEVPNPF